MNVRSYLLSKELDGSRIDLRVGDAPGRAVDSVLVPVGGEYTEAGTSFDASTVHPPVYGASRRSSGRARHRVLTRHRRARR